MPVLLVALAVGLRIAWVALVPTVPRSDYEMYLASAAHLAATGHLDDGFVYMPGWIAVLAALRPLGVLGAKLAGVALAGVGAGALFGVVRRVADRRTAVVATVLYAVWPAGIALGSVVGTDVPFTAVVLVALWVLVVGSEVSPRRAALACGVLFGLAAYLRAVALPLGLVVGLGWWLPRVRARWAIERTALTVVACLAVLAPWAIYNRAARGEVTFTDWHGGVTRLLGVYPNTDGAYSAAALDLVVHATGAPFYVPPHPLRDRAAYQLAGQIVRHDRVFAATLPVAHAGRLFSGDEGVLCWSATCPGVLPAGFPRGWLRVLAGVANGFYYLVGLAAVVGAALALRERRRLGFLLLPPALCLAALYAFYFGAPRYHVTIFVLALPLAAQLGRRARLGWPVAIAALVLGLSWTTGIVAARVRARHHWNVTPCQVGGAPRLCDGTTPLP